MTSQTTFTVEDPPGGAAESARGSSFYAAMRIMPPGQREAMFEIYSFCRAVDDIADDQGPAAPRLQQLQRWRDDIAAVYHGSAPARLAGLAVAVREFRLRQDDFLAIIDGMEMDVIADIQGPDMATLDLYCERVASAVGRLSSRVFGLEDEDGKRLAHHLGRALQLTNILRDLDEDAEMNRLYLPREFLADAGITTTDPNAVLSSAQLGTVCQNVAAVAQKHFVTADAIMDAYPRRIVRTPRVMAEAYKSILEALLARGWTAPRERVSLGKMRLGLILIRLFIL